jgi:transposase
MAVRKEFSSEFKAKVALAALKGDKTLSQISSAYSVHCTQVSAWRKVIQKRLAELFNDKSGQKNISNEKLIDELYQNIGRLKVENEWIKKNWIFDTTGTQKYA